MTSLLGVNISPENSGTNEIIITLGPDSIFYTKFSTLNFHHNLNLPLKSTTIQVWMLKFDYLFCEMLCKKFLINLKFQDFKRHIVLRKQHKECCQLVLILFTRNSEGIKHQFNLSLMNKKFIASSIRFFWVTKDVAERTIKTTIEQISKHSCPLQNIKMDISCSVCTESFVAEDEIVATQCGHIFHIKCL